MMEVNEEVTFTSVSTVLGFVTCSVHILVFMFCLLEGEGLTFFPAVVSMSTILTNYIHKWNYFARLQTHKV